MIPTVSDLVQLGVAGMAIFALVAVVLFMLKTRDRESDKALRALIAQGHAREQALAHALEKSREDRIRLEQILERNTDVIQEDIKLTTRVLTLLELRFQEGRV
ncbi:MAG TPA: hypothetical protein VFT46_06230 [Holophagaceae bacterium]|nr:hypothetical protein [Holophagaceae bacterium]